MSIAAISNLLEMGFGERELPNDANTVVIQYQDTNLVIWRGTKKRMTVYVDTENKRRVSCDWENWLPSGASIASSAWSVEDGSTTITLADDAFNSTGATEVYASAIANSRNQEIWIKNKIVTDATVPETESASILIKVVRTTGQS